MYRTQDEVDASGKRARAIYHTQIKPQLTDDDENKFIAIDPDSGEWGISDNEEVAVNELRRKVDAQYPLVIVHPRIWVDRFGSWQPVSDQ